MIAVAALLIACGGWDQAVTIGLYGANDTQWEAAQEAVYSLNAALNMPGETPPRTRFVQLKRIGRRQRFIGSMIYLSTWLPEDDVGTAYGPISKRSTIFLLQAMDSSLEEVLVHEIGHLLGLDHSKKESDIMWKIAYVHNLNPQSLSRMRGQLVKCDEVKK